MAEPVSSLICLGLASVSVISIPVITSLVVGGMNE